MSRKPEPTMHELEEQLDNATRTLAGLRHLNPTDAERVEERMDRLASQLLAATEPPSLLAVHERLRTEPLSDAELEELHGEMGPPDGEG